MTEVTGDWRDHRMYVTKSLEEIKTKVDSIHDDVLSLKVKMLMISAAVAAVAGPFVTFLFHRFS